MSPIEQLGSIARAAVVRLNESFNAPDVIPFGKAALELIDANPDWRQEFVNAFADGVESPEEWDPWFIEFCVHSLRWPELKSKFELMSREAISKDDWRAIPVLGHILDAFDDDWENALTFYSDYYGKR